MSCHLIQFRYPDKKILEMYGEQKLTPKIKKVINHWYDEKKWATHDWPLWNMMFPEYLNSVIN